MASRRTAPGPGGGPGAGLDNQLLERPDQPLGVEDHPDPLEHERGDDHRPALAGATDHPVVGHDYVVEEHLVEVG